MKSLKSNKGFTLVELVVVIAILGILAGIAIPRFLDATATARGAKIVADMRTLESAQTIYYAKNGQYPASNTVMKDLVQGGWPTPPTGSCIIAHTTGTLPANTTITSASEYTYTPDADLANPGSITLTATKIEGAGSLEPTGNLSALLGAAKAN